MKFDRIPLERVPPQVLDWLRQLEELLDRYVALCLYGPTRTGKTHLARQFGHHLYFRGSINWNKWATGVGAAKYIVFDDIDWSAKNKYTRDTQKAIFSGQASFDECSSDAYMRTITHGKPVIVCMNNETLEEGNVLKEWQAD